MSISSEVITILVLILINGLLAMSEAAMLASRKANAAFQMLQVVHRAMLQAYAEMRDMRV